MRELFALILLLSLILASFVNVYYLGKIRDRIDAFLTEAVNAAGSGDRSSAVLYAENALSYWNSFDSYTHIVLKHDKLDDITSLFFDTIAAVKSGDNGEIMVRQLQTAFRSLYDMERLRFGSIF